MMFKKAYYKKGEFRYNIPETYTVIFNPFEDIYKISEDPQGVKYNCVYCGCQCPDDDLGEPVPFDDLPEPVKKHVATIMVCSFY